MISNTSSSDIKVITLKEKEDIKELDAAYEDGWKFVGVEEVNDGIHKEHYIKYILSKGDKMLMKMDGNVAAANLRILATKFKIDPSTEMGRSISLAIEVLEDYGKQEIYGIYEGDNALER